MCGDHSWRGWEGKLYQSTHPRGLITSSFFENPWFSCETLFRGIRPHSAVGFGVISGKSLGFSRLPPAKNPKAAKVDNRVFLHMFRVCFISSSFSLLTLMGKTSSTKVIQAVPFRSPIFGGHSYHTFTSFEFSGPRFSLAIPKKGTNHRGCELPGFKNS